MAATFLEINPNNSCLLVASHKKSAHFPGNLFLPSTFLWIPFPLFSLVDSLMLLGMYLSHTISTRVVVLICVGERFYQHIHQTSQH